MEEHGNSLPQELLLAVLNRLSARPLAVAACVCRSWNTAAFAVNSIPRFFSALSNLPRLEDAMDAVLEEVLAAPFWPDFAIVFAGSTFQLSQISAMVRRRLPKKMPLIACNSAGVAGRDIATGEHIEMIFDAELCDYTGHHGLVMAVGRFPGVHVKSLKLHNALSVEEVESFVAAASTAPHGGPVRESPLAILLLGDPNAHPSAVLETLDKAYGGKSTIVGGLAALVEDMEAGCLLAHCAPSTTYVAENSIAEVGKTRRKSPRLAEKEAISLLGTATRCDFVSLVFMEERGSSSTDTSRKHVRCKVAAAGGLKAVGPIYKVVSVRETKDIFAKEMSTQISCEREGVLMDGFAVLEDIDTEINGTGIPPNHIGIFRKQKRQNQSQHFSFHELLETNEEYLFISGGGVKTRDAFQFYQLDPSAARLLVHETLSSVTGQINAATGSNRNEENMIACNLPFSPSAKNKVIGGLLFGCAGRGPESFGEPNVESSIFQEKLPGTSMAGMLCLAEFGPPAMLRSEGDIEVTNPKAIENFFSSMYLLFYT